MGPDRAWLFAGGVLSLIAALLHLGCIAGGPGWYRFFGAGEGMVIRVARGDLYPTIVTFAIASILAISSAYALSGAGVLPRLPLRRAGLIAIAAIYLARGLLWLPGKAVSGRPIGAFDYWSSAIVFAYGAIHAIGTATAWPHLTRGTG